MAKTYKEAVENLLYFWEWMNKEDRECDVCGVKSEIAASIFLTNKYVARYQGKQTIRMCQYCYNKIEPLDTGGVIE